MAAEQGAMRAMESTARKVEESEVSHETGTVARTEGEAYLVRCGRGLVRAHRAVSCLVEPCVGDRVIVAVVASGSAWVLAVLDRGKEERKTSIRLDGDLHIELKAGRFTVAAQEGVALVTPADLSVTSGRTSVTSGEASVVVAKASLLIDALRAEIARVQSTFAEVDQTIDRLHQRLGSSYRRVDALDQVKAERIEIVAQTTLVARGEHALVSAKELVKIDGGQVHLG